MAELVKVVVDAMGGDLAPVEPVKSSCRSSKRKKRYPGHSYRSGKSDSFRA